MKSEPDIPDVGLGITILQPLLLPSAKPTYINILSDIASDGVHSSSFATATDYETSPKPNS